MPRSKTRPKRADPARADDAKPDAARFFHLVSRSRLFIASLYRRDDGAIMLFRRYALRYFKFGLMALSCSTKAGGVS